MKNSMETFPYKNLHKDSTFYTKITKVIYSPKLIHDTEAVVLRCFVKKVFLKISQNLQENTCARVSFLIKLQVCNFIKKETLIKVFSCEFCEILRTHFYRTPLVAAPNDAPN